MAQGKLHRGSSKQSEPSYKRCVLSAQSLCAADSPPGEADRLRQGSACLSGRATRRSIGLGASG